MAEESNVKEITAATFETDVLAASKDSPVLVLFHAKWHPPSKQMFTLLPTLAKQFPDVKCCFVDGDANEKLVKKESVRAYPTTFVYRFGGSVFSLQGADPPSLVEGVKEAMKKTDASGACNRNALSVSADERLRLVQLVNSKPIIMFMKGTKEAPYCKFSKEAVALLNDMNVDYGYFDVFQDRSVRDGLKVLYEWPTFPQLFIKGELIGGIDIMKEMAGDGSLKKALEDAAEGQEVRDCSRELSRRSSTITPRSTAQQAVSPELKERLEALVRRQPLMLFMKGEPGSPKCGFSEQIVDLLKMGGFEFGHFDILEDEEVRAGLKTLYDWPTFPQVFAHGELLGGLDVIKEILAEGGTDALNAEIEDARKRVAS